MMTEILDIVCEREEMNYMDADGWINEERQKEIKTTNEVGLVMVSHTLYINMNTRSYCEYVT